MLATRYILILHSNALSGQRRAATQLDTEVCHPVCFLLLAAWPGLVCLQACDAGDASITDAALIKFLSASGPWLEQVQAVDLKQCHYVTANLLAFLRTACPKLRKLAPSRWAEHTAMAEVAQFADLEVRAVSLQHPCWLWPVRRFPCNLLCWSPTGRQHHSYTQLPYNADFPLGGIVKTAWRPRAAVCQDSNVTLAVVPY
jgi:hypothetical protein